MSARSRIAAALVALGGFATMGTAFHFGAYDTNSPFAWVPMGVLAALLVTQGSRFWPALACGAIAAALVADRSLLMIVPGTATAVLTPWMLARYFESRGIDRDLGRSTDVLRFGITTLVVSAIPPTIVTALVLPTHAGVSDLLRPWVNWWLCSTIGIALLVPMALGLNRAAWRTIVEQRWLALALLTLAIALLVAATDAPALVRGRWLMPAAIILTVISAIRLGTTPTSIIATIMTVGAGVVILPRSSADAHLVDSGSVWAIGMALTVLTFTIHVLLAQREEAEQRLRGAEFAHRMEVLEATRAEQQRLSREMHDALGQELTAVSLLAHAMVRKLSVESSEIIDDGRTLAETADQAHRTAREIARGMAPRFMDGEDVGLALRTLAERMTRCSRVALALELEAGPILPRQVSETLYRVAQEALSNAMHHARASRIAMRLRYDAGHCHLDIDDNGRGFDPTDVASGHGLGLRTMRYRCELAGGSLQLESAPQAGTRIRVNLPVDVHSATHSQPGFVPAGAHEAVPKASIG